MSHEIRAPLGVIMGFTDLALEENFSAAERKSFLNTIKRNRNHLLNLINDILDLSKVECGQVKISPEAFDWKDIVLDIVKTMKPTKQGLNLILEAENDIPPILIADAYRIRQVLINLVSNAIKFTEKGTILINIHLEKNGRSSKLIMDVTDTGIGIAESEQSQLFKPFQQANSMVSRHFGGTGLGLDLSRKLAVAMGGDLFLLKSEKGKGSTFRFSLPALFELGIRSALSQIDSSV